MAHESFEDTGVAEVLNSGFVAVKVDREERPDVDAVYMEAVQLLTGGGGWPMTVLALADGRPFWGGTYLPRGEFPEPSPTGYQPLVHRQVGPRGGRLPPGQGGAPRRSAGPVDGWSGAATAGRARRRGACSGPSLAAAAEGLLARYDPQWGGFGAAPKFPQATSLEVLAQYWWRSGDERSLEALTRTLDAMSSGGIYDHLAGGFARYSTDRHWLVPHFEKMLYDNALLVLAYTHAWQLTGSPRYRQVVDETVGYLLSPPIRLPEGAWASAEDADSARTPVGKRAFFTRGPWPSWKRWAARPPPSGTVPPPPATGKGPTSCGGPVWADIARSPEIDEARQRLFERRQARFRPGLDGKVLAEWNAMAVAALAYAGSAFGRPEWVAEAARTAEVLLSSPAATGRALVALLAARCQAVHEGTGEGACPRRDRAETNFERWARDEACSPTPATMPG